MANYNFGAAHPFGPHRLQAFSDAFYQQQLDQRVDVLEPVAGSSEQLVLFHTPEHIERIRRQSKLGVGYLDHGDTPAFIGIYEAGLNVVGTSVAAVDQIMQRHYRRAFVPIAGLHHARRDAVAGFCVFNDCGIVIEHLRKHHQLKRIAYVDIDAHHGDGVFYSFEADADIIIVDLHQDGRSLYPGTGKLDETGTGDAVGTKINVPLPPHADDRQCLQLWPRLEDFLRRHQPEFILLQAGADSIAGDPITAMAFSEQSHRYVTSRLRALADEVCDGRLLVMGGGGYNLGNIAKTWTAVVTALVNDTDYVKSSWHH